MDIRYEWRGEFANDAINALHAEAFDHRVLDDDWRGQVERHSLGWVCAYDDATRGPDGGPSLVGFVNVPWDGAIHAFVLDTMVASRAGRRGIGTRLVEIATEHARAAGCEWLHVDFDEHLTGFYLESCGFRPAPAGLIRLD